MSMPSISMLPAPGCSWPVSILIVVDLPGTVGAEEAEDLAGANRERNAVDGSHVPVAEFDVGDVDRGGGHARRPFLQP